MSIVGNKAPQVSYSCQNSHCLPDFSVTASVIITKRFWMYTRTQIEILNDGCSLIDSDHLCNPSKHSYKIRKLNWWGKCLKSWSMSITTHLHI